MIGCFSKREGVNSSESESALMILSLAMIALLRLEIKKVMCMTNFVVRSVSLVLDKNS